MKIALSEVWKFSELIRPEESGWSYELVAGGVKVGPISPEALHELRVDPQYDTELLPSIFTFREILWQPDVFTESTSSLPALRILKAYCEEVVETYLQQKEAPAIVYAHLLEGLSKSCEVAISSLEKDVLSVKRALGDLRTAAFPIVKFFVFHPRNRGDYQQDAVNRLNYAVKVMLTQFHGKYTELSDPYWEIIYEKSGPAEKSSEIATQKSENG